MRLSRVHMRSQALVHILSQLLRTRLQNDDQRLQSILLWQWRNISAACAGEKLDFHVETPLTHFVHKLQNLTVPKTVAQVSLTQLAGTPSLRGLQPSCYLPGGSGGATLGVITFQWSREEIRIQ